MSAVQLSLPLERPAGTLPLALRVREDARVLRAVCDWTLRYGEWIAANGWTVRPSVPHELTNSRRGWIAVAPDGVPEWWGEDVATTMERAEGSP